MGEHFVDVTEDQILRSLATLSDEVLRSGRAGAATLMPQVAAGLVDAGLREHAPLLVTQATSLWRRQLQSAHEVDDRALEQRLHRASRSASAPRQILVDEHGLEDPYRSLADRLRRSAWPAPPVSTPDPRS